MEKSTLNGSWMLRLQIISKLYDIVGSCITAGPQASFWLSVNVEMLVDGSTRGQWSPQMSIFDVKHGILYNRSNWVQQFEVKLKKFEPHKGKPYIQMHTQWKWTLEILQHCSLVWVKFCNGFWHFCKEFPPALWATCYLIISSFANWKPTSINSNPNLWESGKRDDKRIVKLVTRIETT